MTPFYFDTETYPIRPGRQAPRVVCVQSRCAPWGDRVELREPGLDRLEAALHAPGVLIVGHSVAYDAACSIASRPRLLRPWFEAYSADRVACTLTREKLLRTAEGTTWRYQAHGLLDCLNRYKIPHSFKADDKAGGPDAWRTRYAELDGIPVDRWPSDALRYALADLDVSEVYQAQEDARDLGWLDDEFRQTRGDFWLYLQSCHGMRTDPRAVEAFRKMVEAEHEEHRAFLGAAGIVRSDGSKDTKAAKARMLAVCAEKGLPVQITDTGKDKLREGELDEDGAIAAGYISLNAEACDSTGDETLKRYARYTSVGTLRSRGQRLALAGEIPIQPRFDVLKVTGRTSCSMGDVKPGKPLLAYGDQVQNLNRAPGLRECYTARPGYVLVSVDWSSAELHSLAQVCLWLGFRSRLAEVLNAGRDPHLHFAALRNGWDYEWAAAALRGEHGPVKRKTVKDARQWAKPFNFGFPGGLGVVKFRLFAALAYGIEMTEAEAIEGREAWLDTYPEMTDYFAHVSGLVDHPDARLRHFKSNRWRGDLRYTSAANSYFQGHTADMAKDAGWRLARCYYGIDPSPLGEARPWDFIHDEFIGECPIPTMHECAMDMQRIMEDVGREWCPDVHVGAEPAISYRWRKGAEPAYRDGRLIPYEDRTMHPDVRDKIKAELAEGRDPLHVSWDFGFEESRIREAA